MSELHWLGRCGWAQGTEDGDITRDVLMSEESMYLTPQEGVLNLGVVWGRACRKWITDVLAVPSGEVLTHRGYRSLRSFSWGWGGGGYSPTLRAFVVL